jgi:hypothetical protein
MMRQGVRNDLQKLKDILENQDTRT